MNSFFYVAFLLLGGCSASLWNNCLPEGMEVNVFDYYKSDPIDEKDVNKVIKKFELGPVIDVEMEYPSKYLQIELVNRQIVYKTTEQLANYEVDTKSSSSNATLNCYVKFICEDDYSSIVIAQEIIDSNNNVPFFNRNTYQYKLGMGIKAGFEFTDLMDIFATDIDITKNDVTFEIEENEWLSIERANYYDEYAKTFKAKLILLKDIVGSQDLKFTIYAKDGASKGTATVQIIVEK